MKAQTLDVQRICTAAALLRQAEQPIRILRSVSWPPEVRERFFAAKARELPKVAYRPTDPDPTLKALAEARKLIVDDSAVDTWLARQASAIEHSAHMLAAVGTADFFTHSRALYGAPEDLLEDQASTSLKLARSLDQSFSGLGSVDLGAPNPACHLAEGLAETMRQAVEQHFGASAPDVEVVNELSANALAGPRRIRLRRTACFTDRDVYQLIHHEAYIHVGTSLNGLAQEDLPILASGHAGTTRTQEGLAVFAELMSGTLDPSRMRRLAERVLAIQMAVQGADFLEVYAFFLERNDEPGQAFESSRRVFRGGLVLGGAPFTKDIVYLDGLLRVHNFLRAAVAAGRSDCIRLLFCGKLALEDVPALGQLAAAGLCRPPRFLPPWANDLRFLVASLAYSAFLNQVELHQVSQSVQELLADTPKVAWSGDQGNERRESPRV